MMGCVFDAKRQLPMGDLQLPCLRSSFSVDPIGFELANMCKAPGMFVLEGDEVVGVNGTICEGTYALRAVRSAQI